MVVVVEAPVARVVVAMALLLGLGAVDAAATGYLQLGVDAARTGVLPGLGPERDDRAFELFIPGSVPAKGEPLVLDGAVYAAVQRPYDPWEDPPEGLETNGVVRVDLQSAQAELLVDMGEIAPLQIASDGSYLYVLRERGMDAYSLGGALEWSWEHPEFTTFPERYTTCVPPALRDGVLFVYCNDVALRDPLPRYTPPGTPFWGLPTSAAEVVPFVAAVDLMARETLWSWGELVVEAGEGAGVAEPHVSPFFLGERNLGGVSVIGEHVLTIRQDPAGLYATDLKVYSFDVSDGSLAWEATVSLADQAAEGAQGQDAGFVDRVRLARLVTPFTGTSDEAYFVADDLIAIHPATGAELWRHKLPQPQSDLIGGEGYALSGNDLYVASRGVLFKFNTADATIVWQTPIGAGEHFDDSPLVLAGGVLYARTHAHFDVGGDTGGTPDLFYAVDPVDGTPLWKHRIVQVAEREVIAPAQQFAMAVADGVMVLQGVDGTLRVLGVTPASLQPQAAVSNTFPAVGEEVRADLSATLAGAHGNASAYRAQWGDGRVSDWGPDPVLAHAYAREGEHTAIFAVRNDAGQTATTAMTIHVGGTPPPLEGPWNPVTWAFAPENQNMTFGLLGILLALGGGLFGVVHRRRSRQRLQHEIRTADGIYEAGKATPTVCAQMLAEHKSRARRLTMEGKLTEAQFPVVESHVDGLVRSLRVASVEDELEFLPMGLLRALRTLLADGKITRYERDAFLKALKDDRVLTRAQKTRVRERLEEWFEADAKGARVA